MIPMAGAMIPMLIQMIMIPAIFNQNPNFIIWGSLIKPEP
jgi:hypothetical protein